jgi:hypothetical protein
MSIIDPNLKQWATAKQSEVVDLINQHGGIRAAARAAGAAYSGFHQHIELLKRKAALAGYSPDHDMTRTVPAGYLVKGVSTYYNAEGKAAGQWVKSTLDQQQLEETIRTAIEALASSVKRAKPIAQPKRANEDLLCVYPMGDPHFGMYAWWEEAGEDFDIDIAERITCNAIDRLIASAPPAETALLLNLGDMFHADNQKNVTNSGHQLDVDGRWAKVLKVGLRAMIYCVDSLLRKHQRVIFRINKGNHDGHSSYALAMMLSCYYDKEPRVTVDLSPALTWYYRFGKNLIGSTHGDTIKGKDMMGIMAADRPEDWGGTKFRAWYVGHVHHHDSKEYAGGVVEYFRTLAAKDAWHAGQGYRAGRDMRLIVLHREHGEIERHRCDIGSV